ncbi:hypothetical protein ACJMK2_037265 [Sinanodonta woodiana]|uniref:MULE transposase domain-containing protein n=1 Tax=Sinanodonta woodiana TaxID=1069815 RepID=A0ABD3WJT5_SINWO
MSERKSSRGRKRTLTDSARKRKKKDSTAKYNQARICLGDQHDRWMEIKEELNVKTHAEVAKVLIDRFTNCQEDGSSIPKKRLDEIDPNNKHIQKLTSTPGPGNQFMVVPSDVSEITSSDHDPVNSNNEMSGVEEMHSVSHTEGTAWCQQKSTPCNMSSTFVNPFDLTIDVTESYPDDDDLTDEDYEPNFNLTIRSTNNDMVLEDDRDMEESYNEEEESLKPDIGGPGINKIQLENAKELLRDTPYIVFSSCLENMLNFSISSVCNFDKCTEIVSRKQEVVGSALYVKWVCNGGHMVHKWCSQPILNNRLHAGDLLLAAAILFSGNNFKKVAMLAKFLRLPFPGESSFNKIQRTYLILVVDNYWIDTIRRMCYRDIPGHTAQYCSYTFMEYDSKEILSIVTMDKRVTDHKSGNLEKACFLKGLQYLIGKNLHIKEVVTDAHTQIAALMKKDFPDIQHSFDVWHGAKNFGKKICRAASKDKQTAELTEWSKDIVNHLWHCYNICNTKEEFSVRTIYFNLLNHVVDKHEWLCPQDSAGKIVRCQHGPLDSNREKGWLKPNSPAHVALRKLVLDKRFLNQTHHYLTFRSTAELENFQNLILMYASKRIAYRPPTYRSRNLLAAIDHNRHINRPSIVNRDGTLRYQRSFNKKSRRWSAYPVKEDKSYDYITELMEKVIERRLNDTIGMNRPALLETDDPRRISRVLAPIPPPATAEIVQQQKSRFSAKQDDTLDTN